ncbi:unnamed protein product [Symbiodinium sp. CCMP2592]|nr:unnamed protein product [Symbiodinium sp. CCMP2592]
MAWSLLQKDIEKGHLFELPVEKLRCVRVGAVTLLPANLVLSKLPVRVPNFESIQRFLSLVESGSECHGSPEQGFSCFVFKGRWFAYRSCYFGARWAGYWFARLGAHLVRLLHQFVRVPHGLFLYVDDGLLFLPAGCAAHLSSTALMFVVALGIPLSWEKLQLSRKLGWIGWVFDLCTRSASAPADKVKKAAAKLRLLLTEGRKVERRDVDKLIGLLLWWTNGAVWLRPWLQAARPVPAFIQASCCLPLSEPRSVWGASPVVV